MQFLGLSEIETAYFDSSKIFSNFTILYKFTQILQPFSHVLYVHVLSCTHVLIIIDSFHM